MKTICISLDTLRADRLSTLGYDRPLTPHLDRLAGEGALFTHTFASDIPTQPSHTSLFTGQVGASTDIVSHFFPPAALSQDVAWLPTVLQQAGHRTGAVDHLFVMKDWFIRGYDDYMPPPGRSRSPGEVVNDLAFRWLDEHAADDFFLFLHFWDAHIPYVPPQPFRDRFAGRSAGRYDPEIQDQLRSRPSYPLFYENNYRFLDEIPNLQHLADLYDAEIAYLDDQIGRLAAHLAQLGILDDTLLVIFGDHGEVMTEHDSWFDHAGLYDAVTHVPLILRYPRAIEPGRHDGFVQLVDVFPTVLELADLPVPAGIDGVSLLPQIRGEAASTRDRVYLSECTWEAARGVRTHEWKLIRHLQDGVYDNPEVELFFLPTDPDEQANVADAYPEVVAELSADLDRWVAERLAGRPDPIQAVIDSELPAVARLRTLIADQAQQLEVPAPRGADVREVPGVVVDIDDKRSAVA